MDRITTSGSFCPTPLVVVFGAAAVMMVVGGIASLFNPGRYGAD